MKKFFVTQVNGTVFSNEPIGAHESVSSIADRSTGDVLKTDWEVGESREVDEAEFARLCKEHGEDPAFFGARAAD